MRKLTLIALLLPFFSFAQKLQENNVDEFTKKTVKRTTWEKLCTEKTLVASARASKIDNDAWLNLKVMAANVFSVDKGAALMLKVQGDSIVTLANSEYQLSCSGCGATGIVGSGAPGVELSFYLEPTQYQYLLNHPVQKVRLYTSKGYMEAALSEKNAATLVKQLQLLQ